MNTAKVQVVAYDGSPLSELALHRAIRFATAGDLPTIHLLMVAEERGDRVKLPSGARVTQWEALMNLRIMVRAVLHAWELKGTFVRLVCHVTTGEPAGKILELAAKKSAERILLGSQSALHPAAGRVGSVARVVAAEAPCEVHVEGPLTPAQRRPASDPLRVFLILGDGFGLRASADGPKIAAC